MSSQRTFVCLPYSPYSERARWALDHHGLDYRLVRHDPFVGERRLRRLLARRGAAPAGKGRATVPVLLTGDETLCNSWDIVRHADAHGTAPPLVPDALLEPIRELSEMADAAMDHGRALVAVALLAQPAALDETLPPFVPGWVAPLLRPVTRHGARWFARKYGIDAGVEAERRAERLEAMADCIEAFERRRGDAEHVLGTFSYADIVLATMLQAVSPVDGRFIRLGPATKKAWTLPELSERFAATLRWRDGIYERHRGVI
jgi:glutathione S-transferase